MAQRYIKGGIFRKVTFDKSEDGWRFHMNWEPLEKELHETQVALDTKVWEDMMQYMPYDEDHQLINETAALNAQNAGSGKVYKYNPLSDYGHYQYEGIVYVDPVYGYACFPAYDESGAYIGLRSRTGVEKIPSNRLLHYTNPQARRHWDEVAILHHKKEWENLVLRKLTGGKK